MLFHMGTGPASFWFFGDFIFAIIHFVVCRRTGHDPSRIAYQRAVSRVVSRTEPKPRTSRPAVPIIDGLCSIQIRRPRLPGCGGCSRCVNCARWHGVTSNETRPVSIHQKANSTDLYHTQP
jgi:hypothetical protein